jgi:uncharacterized protein YbaR (Trm112 family)
MNNIEKISDDEREKLVELLEYICCPKCKGDLELIEEKEGLFYFCKNCKTRYLIKEGIPILLTEEDYEQFK